MDYDSVGGMQVQTWRQAVWLAEAGIHQHVMTIGFPGLPKLRQLHPFLWVERTMVPMPRIRSEFSGLVGLTQSWAAATLGALLHRARKQDFDVVHAHLDGQIPSLSVPFARYCEAHRERSGGSTSSLSCGGARFNTVLYGHRRPTWWARSESLRDA